ncbi:MAG: UDP-N-acetylmuramate dehydrogenase [Chloroflexi bacterium]|nr:UDP-N-acetylmuramate dehydrogenase [Chloroflexota bacterium]
MAGLAALSDELCARGYAGRLRVGEPLARHTTFRIGGAADLLLVARRCEELGEWVALAHEHRVPFLIIGAGSNLLVADGGVRGLTIVNACREFSLDTYGQLWADAGTSLAQLARISARQGWAGLEWAVGIPGTLGGAVVGNAGAFGGCMADVIRQVLLLQPDGRKETLDARELAYDYRSSALKRAPRLARPVVLRALLELRPGDPATLAERMRQIQAQRRAQQPRGHCAGSVFRRTARYPAGFLIDRAGLKGSRFGDAVVSPKHANFIMNAGAATAADVLALIEYVRRVVWEQFQEDLQPEIEFVGDWADLPMRPKEVMRASSIQIDRK